MKLTPDDFWQYSGPHRRERELHILEGMIQAFCYDDELSEGERDLLLAWCERSSRFSSREPYITLITWIRSAVGDGVVTEAEKDALVRRCRKFVSEWSKFDRVEGDLCKLFGVLGGVVADDQINTLEREGMRTWLNDHTHLKGRWPYDELDALLQDTASVTQAIEALLLQTCYTYVLQYAQARPASEAVVTGVCAVQPDIEVAAKACHVVGSADASQAAQLEQRIEQAGGRVLPEVCGDLDYLVVTGHRETPSPCLVTGEAVTQAMALRQQGARLSLVRDSDLLATLD